MSAGAQEDHSSSSETILIDPVVVVGSRAPRTLAETASAVYYIDRSAIRRGLSGGQNLATIISHAAPSLDIPSEARTNFGQNLRGRPALVMIDGVSLNSSRGIGRQFDSINPFNIDHIEVLSGATAVYGGNATGGIINIVTKKAEETGLHGESLVSVGSGFNADDDLDFTLAQSISGGSETLKGRIAAVFGKSRAFYDGSGQRLTPDIIQGSLQYNDVLDVMAGLTLTPDDRQRLDLTAQYYDSDQDSPYAFDFGPGFVGLLKDPSRIQPSRGFDADRQAGTNRYQLNLNYQHDDLFAGHHFIGQISHRREKMSFIPFIKTQYGTLSASKQETTVTSLRVALVKEVQPLTLTYGLDASHEDFRSDQMLFDPRLAAQSGGLVNHGIAHIGLYPRVAIDDIAVFLQGDYALRDDIVLSGGYRFERMKNRIDDFVGADQQALVALGKGTGADAIPGGDNRYDVSLFNLGVNWDYAPGQQTWLKFAQGFALPDPAKYYGLGKYALENDRWVLGAYTGVNRNPLAGIKTNGIELGWRFRDARWSLQGAAYYSLSDKSIDFTGSDNLNIDVIDHKRRVYGVEGEGDYRVNDRLSLGGQFHVTRSDEKDADDTWRRSPVVYASASKIGAHADYQRNAWNLRLASTTMLDLEDDDGHRLDGYTTVDAFAGYALNQGRAGTINLSVTNLLDKDYTTIWGQNASLIYGRFVPEVVTDYHGRGRTLTISYHYAF